jgi:hypothetical protein
MVDEENQAPNSILVRKWAMMILEVLRTHAPAHLIDDHSSVTPLGMYGYDCISLESHLHASIPS